MKELKVNLLELTVLVIMCLLLVLLLMGSQNTYRMYTPVPLEMNYFELKDDKATIVVFTAKWCTACVKQHKELNELKYYANIKIYDIDTKTGKDMFNKHNGNVIPYILFIEDNKVKKHWVGYTPAKHIKEYINK
jgi:thiol-disulfide isomerase/thioredoxin